MKSKAQLTTIYLLFYIICLIFLACTGVEIGIEATPTIFIQTPGTPEYEVDAMSTEASSWNSTPTSVSSLVYSNKTFGFQFKYPNTWIIQESSNSIMLYSGPYKFNINFMRANEKQAMSPSPDQAYLEERDRVNFLTQAISRYYLIKDGKVISVYYNAGKEIQAGPLLFTFQLATQNESASQEIPENIIAETDQIIESFEIFVEPESTQCIKKATVIEETVPDNTLFSPGSKFEKTWKLMNSGTCNWTEDYRVIFASEDQMSGPDFQKLLSQVLPGEMIDIVVELVAPASNGIYRGNWMLQDSKGNRFGLGINGDKPFWVQISVGEILPDIVLSLGEPTIRDNLSSANFWFLLDTPYTKFLPGEGNLVLQALIPGKVDEWGISRYPNLKSFYLEYTFTTGDICKSLDRYGMIVRSPEPSQGYAFSFSCDGRYRFYKWDGGNYWPLQEWKSTPLINQGPHQINRMGLFAKGTLFRLYANGQLLTEIEDDSYLEGKFGVLIGAYETPGFTVFFEDAVYWKFGE